MSAELNQRRVNPGQGRRIAAAMRRKGLSQVALAKALGLTSETVCVQIGRDRPWLTQIHRVAAILDVPVEWITTGHPPQPWEAADGAARGDAAVPAPFVSDTTTTITTTAAETRPGVTR